MTSGASRALIARAKCRISSGTVHSTALEKPASFQPFGRRGLFNGIPEAVFTVSRQRVAHLQIGDRKPAFAVDLDAVIHAAPAGQLFR